jgi:hypothetical protein
MSDIRKAREAWIMPGIHTYNEAEHSPRGQAEDSLVHWDLIAQRRQRRHEHCRLTSTWLRPSSGVSFGVRAVASQNPRLGTSAQTNIIGGEHG